MIYMLITLQVYITLLAQPTTFTIQTETYTASSNVEYATWTGNYRAVRFTQVKTSGSITKILYRG